MPFSRPLAVLTPLVGVLTQTFARRHIEGLHRCGTAVVTDRIVSPFDDPWRLTGPVLELDGLRRGVARRVSDAVVRRMGCSTLTHRARVVGRFLGESQVDVAMGEFLDWSVEWLDVCRRTGIRFFVHAHGNDVSGRLRVPAWRAQYRRYNEADGIITPSHYGRTRLVELGLAPSKVHVVPYGVDVPLEPILRAEREVVRCLAVGRLTRKKAPLLLLDAFRRALETEPRLRLDMVGDGLLASDVETFIGRHRLDSHVVLHGSQPHHEVLRLMQRADLFIQHNVVHPDDGNEEGLPVAILEAMAHALPVVCTRHAGIPEAVAEGETGYLVDEGDSAGMAERIVRLARDASLRRDMGAAGWRCAGVSHTWRQERESLQEILGLGSTDLSGDEPCPVLNPGTSAANRQPVDT